jgi:hypothetical protein
MNRIKVVTEMYCCSEPGYGIQNQSQFYEKELISCLQKLALICLPVTK